MQFVGPNTVYSFHCTECGLH